MNVTVTTPAIRQIDFKDEGLMIIHLENNRILSVPLAEFPDINVLSKKEKREFEIIDGHYLSFLAIDEVYSVNDLIGLSDI